MGGAADGRAARGRRDAKKPHGCAQWPKNRVASRGQHGSNCRRRMWCVGSLRRRAVAEIRILRGAATYRGAGVISETGSSADTGDAQADAKRSSAPCACVHGCERGRTSLFPKPALTATRRERTDRPREAIRGAPRFLAPS